MTDLRPMTAGDTAPVLDMMRAFYSSPAVLTNGSDEIFLRDIAACVGDSPYAEGYVFPAGEGLAGYAMAAKSWSTEFGCPCIWIEDLYIRPEYRGRGSGAALLRYLEGKYPDCVLRLEVEEENEHAVHVYRKEGFEMFPYAEMKLET